MTGEFPHKGPVTRKMFPFDDVIMWWFTLIPFASWFLLPALPLNYALSYSENGLVPQERIKTIFSQNKAIFKQKMSLKMVFAKYQPFVGTGATYTTYRLVSNIRRTSIIRRTPTLGNSQLEFSPTISLAKTSNTRRTPSFDFWVSIVDKVRSRPTWSELLRVAWDFDSP